MPRWNKSGTRTSIRMWSAHGMNRGNTCFLLRKSWVLQMFSRVTQLLSTKTDLGKKFKIKEKPEEINFMLGLLIYQLKIIPVDFVSSLCYLQFHYYLYTLKTYTEFCFFTCFHFITFSFILDIHMTNHGRAITLK